MATALEGITRSVKNWWAFALVGVIFILAGIWTFTQPETAYAAIALVFSIGMLADGALTIYFSVQNRETMEGWGWGLATGILAALIGIALLSRQDAAQAILPFYFGFYVLIRGSMMIASSLELKRLLVLDWGWVMLFGVLLVGLGMMMIINPIFSGATLLALLAVSCFILGLGLIMLGLRLRKVHLGVKKIKDAGAAKLNELIDKVRGYAEAEKEEIQSVLMRIQEDIKQAIKEVEEEEKAAESSAS